MFRERKPFANEIISNAGTSSDLCCFCGGGISHDEDIMHSHRMGVSCESPQACLYVAFQSNNR